MVSILILILALPGFAKRLPAATEAGVSKAGCTDCASADPDQPISKKTTEDAQKQLCEIALRSPGLSMKLPWEITPCDGPQKGIEEFLKTCAPKENLEETETKLLALLARNLFGRDSQLVMRGSPLNSEDNSAFENFLKKWTNRLSQIHDPEMKEMLKLSMEGAKEQWKVAKESDKTFELSMKDRALLEKTRTRLIGLQKELATASGNKKIELTNQSKILKEKIKDLNAKKLDMGVARAAIAYSIMKSVASDDYIKGLVRPGVDGQPVVDDERAKDMQTEEIDLLSFEYPELVGAETNPTEGFEILKTTGSSGLEKEKADIKLKILSPGNCDGIAGKLRFERVACRSAAANNSILNAFENDQAPKNVWGTPGARVPIVRGWLTERTQRIRNQMDTRWDEATRSPKTLFDQPELLAQLTKLRRVVNGDQYGMFQSFAKRCVAEGKLNSERQQAAQIQGYVGTGTMVVTVGATLLGGAGKVAAWGVVKKNLPTILARARSVESSIKAKALTKGAWGLSIGGFTTLMLAEEVLAYNSYENELMTYMISNSRGCHRDEKEDVKPGDEPKCIADPTSQTYKNLLAAADRKSEAKHSFVYAGLGMTPMLASFKLAKMAQVATGTTALRLQQASQGFKYVDIAVDAGWVVAVAQQGNIVGAVLQAGLSTNRFGRGLDEVVQKEIVVQGITRDIYGKAAEPMIVRLPVLEYKPLKN